MRKSLNETNYDAALLRYRPTAVRTGLSEKYLRQGCKDGWIPHVRIGSDTLIYVDLLLEILKKKAMENVHEQ